MDNQDSTWLLTLAENINAYNKHLTLAENINAYNKHLADKKQTNERFTRWVDPRLLIMVKLNTAYPEALPQSLFVDDMHCGNTISRAVNWLADQKLIIIDRLSTKRVDLIIYTYRIAVETL